MTGSHVSLRTHDIIEIEVVGDQTVGAVVHTANEVRALLQRLRDQGKPCLILNDATKMGRADAAARRKTVAFARRFDYDKAAVVGSGGVVRLVSNLMLRAIGKADKVKYFDKRKKAMDWLRA